MVYESDFYTTRRPYRPSPSLSTYTITSEPSRQVRLLPGLGKVHVVHTYDRIVPYVGHKRLQIVAAPPTVVRLRPSTLYREFDRIEHKYRPISYNSYTNDYLNSNSSVIFDDETRLIRAQSASVLQRIHNPVPRRYRPMPLPYVSRYDEVPSRLSNDNYIHRMLISSPACKSEYTTYSTDPVRKYFGQGRLACVTYVGEKSHPRRRNVYMYEDPVRNDIQLLSYYITKFRGDKAATGKTATITVVLSPSRPSRIFSEPKPLEEKTTSEELNDMKSERAARLAKIKMVEDEAPAKPSEDALKKKKEKEAAAKAAEEKAKADAAAASAKSKDDAAKKEAQAKAKEEAARKAELARQEELAAQAAAQRAAELEKLAEKTRQDELAKQAEIDAAKKAEEEKALLEEEKRVADAAKAEEERQQLLRLEEIARQAEDEQEAELARQADELAELARQEAELAEQARKEEELAEQARKEAEQADLEKKQAELAELEKQEQELEELAKQESQLADEARTDADNAQKEAELAELAVQETEDAAPTETEAEPIVEVPAEEEEIVESAPEETVTEEPAVEETSDDVNEE